MLLQLGEATLLQLGEAALLQLGETTLLQLGEAAILQLGLGRGGVPAVRRDRVIRVTAVRRGLITAVSGGRGCALPQ